MNLTVLPERYALARLARDGVPPPLAAGSLAAIVRDRDALTVIAPEDAAPGADEVSHGWRALEVAGPLDLEMTGVLANLAEPLRDAEVPVFVISSFDTDLVLVPGDRLTDASEALERAGHAVTGR